VIALTLLVASIAIADSINPSTVVPALWLASAPRGRGLTSYTLGVFAAYFAGGLVLVFGPGPALIAALHNIRGPVEHALQAAGGAVAIAFAIALWRSRRNAPSGRRGRRCDSRRSAFALGVGIMAIELPTAFMYFGAITAILAAHPAAGVEVWLLVAYNALFVAPLVVILAIHHLAAERAERWLVANGGRLRRASQLALSGIAGAAGSVFVVLGVSGLLAT
jgi:cytochrome c biogenesis protein CcdA